jgi:Apoptosis-antagonizing transcription factor, C-terminal
LLQRCRNDDNVAPGDEEEQEQEKESAQLLCDQVLGNLMKARDRLNDHRRQHYRDDADDDDDDAEATSTSRELLDLLLGGGGSGGDDHDDDHGEAISACLQKSYAEDRAVWKEVLDRRHKDVRLHAGAVTSKQFRSLDASFFDQVEAAVEHEKTRFITHHHKDDEEVVVDDNRLYQQILKDFVGSLSSQSSTANGLPLRAISTKKADVDRKASKGRKVRYAEIPKLVHFTFPLSRPETDLETNAWFRSLFGGAVIQSPVATSSRAKK